MTSIAAKANESLNLKGKTACVAGGTQGIGFGIAYRFAQAGSNVLIVGRTERDVIDQLKSLGKQGAKYEFIKADMSLTSGIKDAASKIKQASGPEGIDYLVMTQGMTPNGKYAETDEGIESRFAIQCLSKFGLAYSLLTTNTIKSGGTVLSVAAPGGSVTEFDAEDPHLKKAKAEGKYGFLMSAKRDGIVIDAFTEEFAARFPQIRFFHVFPGLVNTSALANSGYPWPIPFLASTFGGLVGQSTSTYADLPVYLTANPASRSVASRYLDNKLKPIKLSPWASKGENRSALWDTMRKLYGV